MRVLLHSGPLFLALGVTLIGCSPSGSHPTRAPSASAKTAALPTDLQVFPGSSQVVLTVAGMS
jgi:hypothetical protein